MKTFVRISVAAYVAAGLVLGFGEFGIFPDFYNLKLMSTLAFVSAMLILVPRIVLRRTDDEKKEHMVVRLQVAVAIALIINGLGGLGLYKLYLVGFEYDKVSHFATSLLFTAEGAWLALIRFGKKLKPAIIIGAGWTLFGGIAWEFLEAFSDRVLGTSLFGGGTGAVFRDTSLDVVMNILGIIAGAILVFWRVRIAKKG